MKGEIAAALQLPWYKLYITPPQHHNTTQHYRFQAFQDCITLDHIMAILRKSTCPVLHLPLQDDT